MTQSFYSQQIHPNVAWDSDLQNLYRMEFQQGSSTIPYQSQKITGKEKRLFI